MRNDITNQMCVDLSCFSVSSLISEASKRPPNTSASTFINHTQPRHTRISRRQTTHLAKIMTKKILLLGRKGIVVEDAKSKLDMPEVEILGGTNIDDVRNAFSDDTQIDHVFMGAGIELDRRLEIVAAVFELSGTTTVHLKDATSGPQGFLPFVKAVLEGLK